MTGDIDIEKPIPEKSKLRNSSVGIPEQRSSLSALDVAKSKSEGNIRNADDKNRRKSLQKPTPSYMQPTKSSKTKVSRVPSNPNLYKDENKTNLTRAKSTFSVNNPGSPKRSSIAKKNKLNADLKVKFKSTPDLLSAVNTELKGEADEIDSYDKVKQEAERQMNLLRRSVTPDNIPISTSLDNLKEFSVSHNGDIDSESTESMSERSDTSATLPRARRSLQPPLMGISVKAKQETGAKKVPPRRYTSSDMTLAQAKEILMGKAKSIFRKTDSEEKKMENTEPVAVVMRNKDSTPNRANISKDFEASPNEPPVKDYSPHRDTRTSPRNSLEFSGIRMGIASPMGQSPVMLPDNNSMNIDKSTKRLSGGSLFTYATQKPGTLEDSRNSSTNSSPRNSNGNLSIKTVSPGSSTVDLNNRLQDHSPPSKDVGFSIPPEGGSLPNLRASKDLNHSSEQLDQSSRNVPASKPRRELPMSPTQFLDGLKESARRNRFGGSKDGIDVYGKPAVSPIVGNIEQPDSRSSLGSSPQSDRSSPAFRYRQGAKYDSTSSTPRSSTTSDDGLGDLRKSQSMEIRKSWVMRQPILAEGDPDEGEPDDLVLSPKSPTKADVVPMTVHDVDDSLESNHTSIDTITTPEASPNRPSDLSGTR